MKLNIEIVNAFVDGNQGGNPAGVVLDANGLTPEQKLIVAKKVGLSETAFVSHSKVSTVKLEFFTPTRQIAHCGHATIATFSRLRELGLIPTGRLSKETIDGTREIIVIDDLVYMEQGRPRYNHIDLDSQTGKKVLASLGTDPGLVKSNSISIVNTGNSFLIVPFENEYNVRQLKPDMELISRISGELDIIGYYPFSPEVKKKGRHAGARMFAPRFGIPEEAATGMAAGPLACYLHDRLGVTDKTLLIEQGHLMTPSSPSIIRINLKLQDEKIIGLMAGGRGRSVKKYIVNI